MAKSPETSAPGNKHASRSAQTRDRFIEAAQRLYAERSIDSVSLNEITVAAGQKNRNALQYHFGNRDGLLQAIIDKHALPASELRRRHLAALSGSGCSYAHAAAQALVMPLAEYIESNPDGIHYIKVLSQLAALNSSVLNPSTSSRITFQNDEDFAAVVRAAVSHLKPAEAQRRLFLAVSITFHTIADVCRAAETEGTSRNLQNRSAMFEQVALSIEALLGAPAVG
jgi:AcrR family transcriptional regulator